MFTQTERLIAVRNLRPKRKQGFLKIISLFSFLGIMLGVAILIIVMSVMNGFRADLTDKIIGLNPHLILQLNDGNDIKNVKNKLSQKYNKINITETVSGEVLAGKEEFGIDPQMASQLASEIRSIHELNVSIGLIIGAGNIFRGMEAATKGMERVTGDYLGMLATIMNAISLQDALEKEDVETRTLSAITVSQIAEPYIRRRALRHLDKNRVVIVAGGTGNPYFTTDTAAALRAKELKANVLLKGTKVDGVYDKDPVLYSDEIKYNEISYSEVLKKNIQIMDLTAITLCKENALPIHVFNINKSGDLKKVILGESIGTTINV